MGWQDNVTILEKTKRWGRLTTAQFAADLWNVVHGNTPPKIYKNPENFFKITYPTDGLKGFMNSVLRRISGFSDSDPVIELESGFGGGKSHTLLACYHTINTPDEAEGFLEEVGWNEDVPHARIAIYEGLDFNPVQGVTLSYDPSVRYKTPWGLIFAQLGGVGALKKLEDNGNALRSPTRDVILEILNSVGSSVILMDEIVWTADTLSAVKNKEGELQAHQVANFLQVLADAVSKTKNCALIYTIPERDSEYGNLETRHLFQEARNQIKERLARVSTPRFALSEGDLFGVVRRRIFDFVSVPQDVITAYLETYANENGFPERVKLPSYKETMSKAYPFHPELLKVIHEHIAVRPSFQKTRDVLRLLTFIVRALLEEGLVKGELILLGDFPLNNSYIKDFLMGKDKNNLAEALQIDIGKRDARARLIDSQSHLKTPLAVNLATSIFLQSLSSSHSEISKHRAIHGVTVEDLYVATKNLKITQSDIRTILNKLTDTNDGCYYIHTEQSQGVTRYLFKEQRTLTSLLHEFRENIPENHVERMLRGVLTEVQGNSRVKCITDIREPSFRKIPDNDGTMLQNEQIRLIFPSFPLTTDSSASDDVKDRVERILNYSSVGSNPQPRKFRNSLAVVVADKGSYQAAVETAKNIIAGEGVKGMKNSLLTDEDRLDLEELSNKWRAGLKDQVLICFSHIFFPKKGGEFRHLSLGVDSFKGNNLAERIFDYLLDRDYVSEKIKAEKLMDPTDAYWRTGIDGNAVKIMAVSDLWLAMCTDASTPRLAGFQALWLSITDVVKKKLGILVKARSEAEADELRISKEVNHIPHDGSFSDYYLLRYGVEYRIECARCEEWQFSDSLINSVCRNCQEIKCPTCALSVIRKQLYGDGTCSNCKGKIKCKHCERFVTGDDLRVDGDRCVHCQGMTTCPRCRNLNKPDNIEEGTCTTCKDWEKCKDCDDFAPKGTDGICTNCSSKIRQENVSVGAFVNVSKLTESNCLKCGSTIGEHVNNICEACSKRQKFRGKIEVDTLNFADMDKYIVDKLPKLSKLSGRIGFYFELEIDADTSKEHRDVLDKVREAIAYLEGEFSENV